MNNLTKILWQLNNYCEAECSYCPVSLSGGDLPPETKDYIRVANLIIESYSKMNREIEWKFDGGEPLDMKDIVTLLKLCRTNGKSMELNTNGGKLWLDWWAVEPYVDKLILTYHYWQNPALIKYIIDVFLEKKKILHVNVPIRPDYFEFDMNRAAEVESIHNIKVKRTALYKNASRDGGMFDYTEDQLLLMSGIKPQPKIEIVKEKPKVVVVPKPLPEIKNIPKPLPPLIKEKKDFETKTYIERKQELKNSSPVYTGKLCNVGIEYLIITHLGWVKGSNCNNQPLGNVWHEGWIPPSGPQVCTMQACTDLSDQKITKFT
jgi:organic radical activating enzyme